MIVVGEKETQNHTVNVRKRDEKKPLGEMTIQEFFDLIQKDKPQTSNLHKQMIHHTLMYKNAEQNSQE